MNPTTPTSKFELLAAFGLCTTVTMTVTTDEGSVTMTGVIHTLGHEDGVGDSFYGKLLIPPAEQDGVGRLVECYFGRFK